MAKEQMDQIDRFTVGLEDQEKPMLVDGGDRLPVILSGSSIEGQWELDNQFWGDQNGGCQFLLLLSSDSPYDELVSICLLSNTMKLIDEIHIGGYYSGGLLQNIVAGERFLEFEIFGYCWNVTLLTTKKYFRVGELPQGARRPLSRFIKPRYLKLSVEQLVE